MAKKTSVKPAEVNETETAANKPVPESISLNDLQILLQIIDLASSRGAFRGTELTSVGAIFDKLNAFLSYIADQQKAKTDAENESADAEQLD